MIFLRIRAELCWVALKGRFAAPVSPPQILIPFSFHQPRWLARGVFLLQRSASCPNSQRVARPHCVVFSKRNFQATRCGLRTIRAPNAGPLPLAAPGGASLLALFRRRKA